MLRDVELEWFALKFQGAMFSKRGNAFQDFFADVMEAAHPGDFERVRPYGNKGDLKCDGFLRSQGTVFQVYAPREIRLAALTKKSTADFIGAKEHWKDEMRGWTFVHNDPDGLPADVVKLIETMQKEHDAIAIETWGPSRLQGECLGVAR